MMFKKQWFAAAIVFAALVAGPAHAVGFYGELLSSNESLLLPTDMRWQLGVDVDFDPLSIDLTQWNVVPGAGITGASLGGGAMTTYDHVFNLPGHTIDEAWLFIGLAGIGEVDVHLDGDFWASGGSILVGGVVGSSVESFLDGDELHVKVTNTSGRFSNVKVLNSLFKAKVSAAPVPEPSAALAFLVGTAIVGRAARSRRRA